MLKLKEEATKIKQFGLSINKPELTIVLIANINRAAKSGWWGTEFRTTMSKIKKDYPYNHVHDATSLSTILSECADSDAARNLRDAPAPGGKALAVSRPALQDAMSKRSSSTGWSKFDCQNYNSEAFINSDGESYETKQYKSDQKRNGRSATSSIASSSDGSSV